MAIPLRQSTASQEVPLGYFISATDGDTEATGLTIANTNIKLWKHGATTVANKNSGGATHIANGLYYTVLDATDTNTLGGLVIFVHVATALAVRVECVVLPAQVFDSLILGTDNLDVSLVQWLGTTPLALSSQRVQTFVVAMDANVLTATAIQNSAITSSKIASGAITATSFASSALAAVWDEARAGHSGSGTFGENLGLLPTITPGTGDGLATTDNVMSVTARATVATVASAGDFTLNVTGYDGAATTDGQFAGMFLVFDLGQGASNAGVPRQITTYTGSTKRVQFSGSGTDLTRPFPNTPSVGQSVTILGLGQ